jgi:outer membrane lipoprotein-sorting protein
MRWLAVLAVLGYAASAYGQENDAEKLFRTMEKTVRAAKALHVDYVAEVVGKTEAIKFKGSLYQTKENRGRLEMFSDANGKLDEVMLMISDGTWLYSRIYCTVAVDKKPPHIKDTGKTTPALLARLGITAGMATASELLKANAELKEPFDVDQVMVAKGFKLGAKETEGPRVFQLVHYGVELKFAKAPRKASVWIDVKTHLPGERTLEFEADSDVRRIAEHYPVFAIDGKIDDKLFEIPK